MKTLEDVGNKIRQALMKDKEVPGDVVFTYWLHKLLDREELLILLKKDIETGEESVNDWLVDVMVSSGRYTREANGMVRRTPLPLWKEGCGDPKCGISSSIAEEFTFGKGELDDNGFWEHPCTPCEEAYHRRQADKARSA